MREGGKTCEPEGGAGIEEGANGMDGWSKRDEETTVLQTEVAKKKARVAKNALHSFSSLL